MLDKPFYLIEDIELDEKFKSLDSKSQKAVLGLRNQGFCIVDLELEHSILDQIISDCNQEYKKVNYEGSGRRRIENAFTFSESVKHLALEPFLLDLLRNAFGRNPIPFQTLNFEKGSEQATHSDSVHFNTYPYGFMCGIWFALEDIDEKNGPLHYYPGSHKLPFFGLDQFSIHGSSDPPSYDLYPEYEKGLQELIEALDLKKESVTMSKGECLIWSANLFHGGDPILDQSRTRHSQVTHYFFEDCFFYTPMLSAPFRTDFHVRHPMNIITGEKISDDELKSYAMKAGIDVSSFMKENPTEPEQEQKSILKRILGT